MVATLDDRDGDLGPASPRVGRLRRLLEVGRSKPLGAAGFLIIVLFVFLAAFAPWLAPYDPYVIDSQNLLKPPSARNWMGTDEFGRDVLSRIIWGARISLTVGFAAVALGTTTGSMLGMLGGYHGGTLDYVIQRCVDILMAFPLLILALAMVAALGASMQNVIIALAIVIAPNAARVLRSTTLSVREQPYVEAALNLGYSHTRIVLRHVLPNCMAPFIIMATAALGAAILTEASLSFLGLGTPPPIPSWGTMLSGKTQSYFGQAPWLAIFPGLAISVVVFGFSFVGDALRDLLDPRLRSR